jgi:hypothetical protein
MNESVRCEDTRGDAQLTGVGKAVDELATVHAIRGFHPRRLNDNNIKNGEV